MFDPLDGVIGGGLIVTEGFAVGFSRGGRPAAARAAACICWARRRAASDWSGGVPPLIRLAIAEKSFPFLPFEAVGAGAAAAWGGAGCCGGFWGSAPARLDIALKSFPFGRFDIALKSFPFGRPVGCWAGTGCDCCGFGCWAGGGWPCCWCCCWAGGCCCCWGGGWPPGCCPCPCCSPLPPLSRRCMSSSDFPPLAMILVGLGRSLLAR